MPREKRKKADNKLSKQMEESVKDSSIKDKGSLEPYEGNFNYMTSTGSTLADLAISGGKVRGGGIPAGIVIEIAGLPSLGKTAWICEIAGIIDDNGGDRKMLDPEDRLSAEFASIFGLEIDQSEIERPNTVNEMFKHIREFEPRSTEKINGIFIDSTAALASELEMEGKKDEYQRRAKDFSQGFRTHARMFKEKNLIVVCSNQLRENIGALPGQEKYSSPGGQAFKFFASLQIRVKKQKNHKIKRTRTYKGVKEEKVIGIASQIEVSKSSVWKPHRTAPLYIIYDYGIDDVRANLEFVSRYKSVKGFAVRDEFAGTYMDDAIAYVEKHGLEKELREETIDLWEAHEKKFQISRKPKERFK